jgi:ATP-binding protein involved in chromosome partitioning
MATPQEILEGLKQVKYPGYSRDIVSFGLVRDIEVGSATVTVTLAPGGASEEAVAQITEAVRARVAALSGGARVEIALQREAAAPARMQRRTPDVPGVRHIIAVASGKGGVGKSTVAVNLAVALGAAGWQVGLLDADVYGPSVPLMLGLHERPTTRDDGRIVPLERYGIRVISLGLFLGEGAPVIWRGPMVNKLLTQFLRDVEWGERDALVIDLPPGTGDAQLTIVQQVRLAGGVIVTTPQDVALIDVQRGIKMFEQVNAPVLGVVENMSYHVCGGCGARAEIFGHGGGRRVAAELGIPLLGEVPLVRAVREGGDQGVPIVVAQFDGEPARAFRELARHVIERVERTAAAAPIIR